MHIHDRLAGLYHTIPCARAITRTEASSSSLFRTLDGCFFFCELLFPGSSSSSSSLPECEQLSRRFACNGFSGFCRTGREESVHDGSLPDLEFRRRDPASLLVGFQRRHLLDHLRVRGIHVMQRTVLCRAPSRS
jgi:hypothetical protein